MAKLDEYLALKKQLEDLDALIAEIGQRQSRFALEGRVTLVAGNLRFQHPGLDKMARSTLAGQSTRPALAAIRTQMEADLRTLAAQARAEVEALLT